MIDSRATMARYDALLSASDQGVGICMGLILPMERVIIDAISLDEEIQLELEQIEEEMAPIDAAWATVEPRQTRRDALPMWLWTPGPEDRRRLTTLQILFLQHHIYAGDIAPLSIGQIERIRFRPASEILRQKARDLGITVERLIDAADMMSDLRRG